MKKNLALFVFIIYFNNVHAQYFEKHVIIDSTTAFWNMVKIKSNRDILIYGYSDWDYQCSYMLDSNGNMKWSHRYYIPVDPAHNNFVYYSFNDISFTGDGGFMLTGSTSDSTYKPGLALFRYDSTGNLLWTKRYLFYRYDSGVSILPGANGKFTLCAATAKTFPFGTLDAIHFLIIDSLGNILKSKRISNDSTRLKPTSMISMGNNFIIEGECALYNPVNPGCFLMKVDNTGNVLKTKFIQAYNSFKGRGLIRTHDNNILFAYGDNTSGFNLMKLDENLDQIWCKTIVPTGIRLDLPYIAESPDNNYLMFGARWNSTTTYGVGCKTDTAGNLISGFQINYLNHSFGTEISPYGNKVFIHSLATQGGQLNENIFFTADPDITSVCSTVPIGFNAIPKLENDSLINITYFENYFPVSEDTIYVTDMALNYFIEDLCSPNSVEETIHASDLQIFPNPVSSTLYLSSVKSHHIEIINLYGEIIKEQNFNSKLNEKIMSDISFLSPGIYFIKAGSEVRKFVKQ